MSTITNAPNLPDRHSLLKVKEETSSSYLSGRVFSAKQDLSSSKKNMLKRTVPPRAERLLNNPELSKLYFDHTGRFPSPTSPSIISQYRAMSPESHVILWRGCDEDQVKFMATYKCSTGTNSNPDTLPPSEEEAKAQVGEQSLRHLVEFSTNSTIASGFGRGSFVVAISIKAKYLKRGSNTEGGWIANKTAPLQLLAWTTGPELIGGRSMKSREEREAVALLAIQRWNAASAASRAPPSSPLSMSTSLNTPPLTPASSSSSTPTPASSSSSTPPPDLFSHNSLLGGNMTAPVSRFSKGVTARSLEEAERKKNLLNKDPPKDPESAAVKVNMAASHFLNSLKETQEKNHIIPESAKEFVQDKALASLYKSDSLLLPQPTSEGAVKKLVATKSEHAVTLWRGCRGDQLASIAKNQSAGGEEANAEAEVPTERQAREQVGELAFGNITEFTTQRSTGNSFSRGSFLIAVSIKAKYLYKGSEVEGGWVAGNAAPVQLLGWAVGEKIKADAPSPDASAAPSGDELRRTAAVAARAAVFRNVGQQISTRPPDLEGRGKSVL